MSDHGIVNGYRHDERGRVMGTFSSNNPEVEAWYGSRISLADQGDRGVAVESPAFVEPSGACLVPSGPFVPVLDVPRWP